MEPERDERPPRGPRPGASRREQRGAPSDAPARLPGGAAARRARATSGARRRGASVTMRPAMKRRMTTPSVESVTRSGFVHEPPPEEARDADERAEDARRPSRSRSRGRAARPARGAAGGSPPRTPSPKSVMVRSARTRNAAKMSDVEEPGPRSSGSTSRFWPKPKREQRRRPARRSESVRTSRRSARSGATRRTCEREEREPATRSSAAVRSGLMTRDATTPEGRGKAPGSHGGGGKRCKKRGRPFPGGLEVPCSGSGGAAIGRAWGGARSARRRGRRLPRRVRDRCGCRSHGRRHGRAAPRDRRGRYPAREPGGVSGKPTRCCRGSPTPGAGAARAREPTRCCRGSPMPGAGAARARGSQPAVAGELGAWFGRPPGAGVRPPWPGGTLPWPGASPLRPGRPGDGYGELRGGRAGPRRPLRRGRRMAGEACRRDRAGGCRAPGRHRCGRGHAADRARERGGRGSLVARGGPGGGRGVGSRARRGADVAVAVAVAGASRRRPRLLVVRGCGSGCAHDGPVAGRRWTVRTPRAAVDPAATTVPREVRAVGREVLVRVRPTHVAPAAFRHRVALPSTRTRTDRG